MNRFKKWPKLDQYFKQGAINFIDLAFAESVLKKLNSDKQEHAALLATLFALSRQGHLTLDLSKEALDFALQVLSISDKDSLSQLLNDGAATFPLQGISEVENSDSYPNTWICFSGMRYYLQRNWVYESEILKHLQRLSKHAPAIPFSFPQMDLRLNEAQRKGIENAMMHSLSLLTGGPGTGKTFTAAEIVKIFLHSFPIDKHGQLRVILTAPTGKAVSQLEGNLRDILSPQVAMRTGTLHALLGIKSYVYEEEKAAMLFADLIIVDECSMLTEEMMAALIEALSGVHRLIFVDDPRQLPPIGAGRPFADLVARLQPGNVEGMFPRMAPGYAELTIPRRQGAGDREDLQLAAWFNGGVLSPGEDQVFEILAGKRASDTVEFVRWDTPDDLERLLPQVLSSVLKFDAAEPAWRAFARSLGAKYRREGVCLVQP